MELYWKSMIGLTPYLITITCREHKHMWNVKTEHDLRITNVEK